MSYSTKPHSCSLGSEPAKEAKCSYSHWLQERGKQNQGEEKSVVPSKNQDDFLTDAVFAICQLLREQGFDRSSAETQILHQLERVYKSSRTTPAITKRISRLADVCARWYQEKEFIDERGRPKPLVWSGRTGSLTKLVARVVGKEHTKDVIRELVSKRLISRVGVGTWLPKSQVVAPDGFDSAQALRGASMVGRLIRTVGHNRNLRYRGDVLLEVMAQVPRLPNRELPAFRKFTKAQGLSFIKAVDDWLESRNLRRNSRMRRSSREAGVVAFAFVEPKARQTNRG
jgi:hypothetical protein